MREQALLEANEAFYAAFRAADVDAMEAVWSRSPSLLCVHPGQPLLRGRDAVLGSWRQILRAGGAPLVCSEARASLLPDVGIVTCLEAVRGEAPQLVATNVFVVEDGGWRMIHHHASPARHLGDAPPSPDPRSLN